MGEVINTKINYTVAELITELQKLPQDLPVLTNGYEGEYENILLPKIINVKFLPNEPYYTGQFVIPKKDEDGFKAVVIEREVRDLDI